jgi:alkylation response protein AidB-like acyl-CoA dehydrogenase
MPEERKGPAERDDVMKLWIRAETLRLTNMRAVQAAKKGQPGPEGSVAKLAGAELNKEIYSKAIDLVGMAGQIEFDYSFRRPGTVDLTGTGSGLGYAFLRARANSIEGGTSEVLRNIMGEQMLGLPGEPRVDKDVAWSEVPRG